VYFIPSPKKKTLLPVDLLRPVYFMYNFRELAIFGDQGVKKFIESNGEPAGITADHLPGYLNGIVKSKQREFENYWLTVGNLPRRSDEQAAGTNVFDNIPESSLFDGVFCNDIGRAA
jgi:hypothetical protein